MNLINKLFCEKNKNILSVYFTAGFPKKNDTNIILAELDKAGVDMIEIGMPFSDPLADGPAIQHSNETALRNGMNLDLLFRQLQTADCKPPVILMGYINPVLQYGIENFCRRAGAVGISGVILPDLPVDEYLNGYKKYFLRHNLKNIFLVTPKTSEKRIRMIDENADGFIYAVSSSSTTGTKPLDSLLSLESGGEVLHFFKQIGKMKLKNPVMIGFGISDKKGYEIACKYANGAIIGSAFIKSLENNISVCDFIKTIRG